MSGQRALFQKKLKHKMTEPAPEVSAERIDLIIRELYGLTCGKVKKLAGYDDKNYHLHDVRRVTGAQCLATSEQIAHGCVLKITHPAEANVPGFVGA